MMTQETANFAQFHGPVTVKAHAARLELNLLYYPVYGFERNDYLL